MRIYVVRHGQSENNLAGIHTGWVQCSLTEKGKNDALMAGRLLKNIRFDRVYCSDLIRAMETLDVALPGRKADVYTPLLREINVGSTQNKSRAQCLAEYGADYGVNSARYDFSPYGGENCAMHKNRVREFLKLLENDPCDCAAVFCHAGTVKRMLTLTLHLNDEETGMACSNGSVSVFEYENNRWKLLAWNCTEALFPR